MNDAIDSNIGGHIKDFSSEHPVVPLRQVIAADEGRGGTVIASLTKLEQRALNRQTYFQVIEGVVKQQLLGRFLLLDDKGGEVNSHWMTAHRCSHRSSVRRSF